MERGGWGRIDEEQGFGVGGDEMEEGDEVAKTEAAAFYRGCVANRPRVKVDSKKCVGEGGMAHGLFFSPQPTLLLTGQEMRR